MAEIIDLVLLAMLAFTALRVIFLRDLFAVVMLFGIFSFTSALIFVSLDAVDVAFTEASVGAGITTVLMLSTLALTERQEKKTTQHTAVLPLLVVFVTGAALIYGTLDMPPFGHVTNPVHQHVAPRYIEQSPQEVGLPNMVTSVLASYRGFDTLGETVVVFAAAVGVLSLLGIRRRSRSESRDPNAVGLSSHTVLSAIAKLIIPFVILFAFYVQFHGDFGPGGGFQAGVIASAAFILYTLVFGLGDGFYVVGPRLLRILAPLGVLIYASVGVLCMLLGGNFLDYNVLAEDPVSGQHYGILVIELGVGITVFAVMLNIFYAFTSRAERV